jgi:hypothetical protein
MNDHDEKKALLYDRSCSGSFLIGSEGLIKDGSNEYPYIIYKHDDIVDGAVNTIEKWLKTLRLSESLDLIISITGGAKEFNFSSSVKKSFKDGISKIAMSTNALIITGLSFK